MDQDEVKVKKKRKENGANYIQPSWPHAWSLEGLQYMAQTMRTCACWINAGNPEGQFLARSGSPWQRTQYLLHPAR